MSDFIERMQLRAQALRAVRGFFHGRDFIEVDTPVALTALAPERHIEALHTTVTVGGQKRRRFLQTSPELPMKRLLALGLPRIFQIAAVFRDTDHSPLHRPEFRLLEWYRRDADWRTLFSDCEELIREVARAGLGTTTVRYQGKTIPLDRPFRRISVDEAFVEHAGFSILENIEAIDLRKRLDDLGIHHLATDSWDDLFHRVFLSRVEPQLCADATPFFLFHYPAPLASLARLNPEDPRVAERVELYLAGMEIANGFGELTSADEQRRRFAEEAAARAAQGYQSYPVDEAFLQALDSLDSASGMALGVERLLMLLLDAPTIDEALFLPWDET